MTVVLMNLGSLYESLYDALNQNYMELGKECTHYCVFCIIIHILLLYRLPALR